MTLLTDIHPDELPHNINKMNNTNLSVIDRVPTACG
jgi:hypothetical protein